MDGTSISQSLIILCVFIFLQLYTVLSIGIKHVQNNWAAYKCQPWFIPFAYIFQQGMPEPHSSPQDIFLSCVNQYNMNFQPYLQKGTNYLINHLSSVGSDIGSTMGSLISLNSATQTGSVNFISVLADTSINVSVIIQHIMEKTQDTFSKIIGLLITFIYILRGIEVLVPSALMTPPGQAIVWIVNTIGRAADISFLQ